jgi:copper(I)-binding protein
LIPVRKALSVALPLLLVLGACQQQSATENNTAAKAPDAKPGTAISEGRLVLPAVKGNPGAAYFTLENAGSGTIGVAAVAIEGAGKAEIHQTIGGSMSAVDQLLVDPGRSLEFAPGELHVMAFDLNPRLAAGGTAEMTVTFADGDKISAPLRIQSAGEAAMGGSEHDH